MFWHYRYAKIMHWEIVQFLFSCFCFCFWFYFCSVFFFLFTPFFVFFGIDAVRRLPCIRVVWKQRTEGWDQQSTSCIFFFQAVLSCARVCQPLIFMLALCKALFSALAYVIPGEPFLLLLFTQEDRIFLWNLCHPILAMWPAYRSWWRVIKVRMDGILVRSLRFFMVICLVWRWSLDNLHMRLMQPWWYVWSLRSCEAFRHQFSAP